MSLNCEEVTAPSKKSMIGILFGHSVQTYFGVFVGTYILLPQEHGTMPANRWTTRLVGRSCLVLRTSKRSLHLCHSSSETRLRPGSKPNRSQALAPRA